MSTSAAVMKNQKQKSPTRTEVQETKTGLTRINSKVDQYFHIDLRDYFILPIYICTIITGSKAAFSFRVLSSS